MHNELYGHSLFLLTDLYQLTMAYGYWQSGKANAQSVFHLNFRRHPFGGQYALCCGLRQAVDLMLDYRVTHDDVQYLRSLRGNDDRPLFDEGFLKFLENEPFRCDVDAMAEGRIALAHEPLLRVCGPLWQAQILETSLLTILNFQTLIATKAARVCLAAEGDPVIEFGLRRAQGPDGGVSASRAAYIGGCSGTSNLLAGKLYDIPVRGTQAHSWVMAFDNELESFLRYAEALPNNCSLLVDTYDTLEGVRQAIVAGQWLRQRGHRLLGVRLDSGDLAQLSIEARRLLDEAGFQDAAVIASSDLDEYEIQKLKSRGARINNWGVGTRLSTAYDQPALGGVYKLSAIRPSEDEPWQYRVKLSEQPVKVSTPGRQQVLRFSMDGRVCGDIVVDELMERPSDMQAVRFDDGSRWQPPAAATCELLLEPVFRQGKLVCSLWSAADARQRASNELAALPSEVRRLDRPQPLPAGLERSLWETKRRLMAQAAGGTR